MSTCLLEGRDMFICSVVLICISMHQLWSSFISFSSVFFQLWFSVPYLLLVPHVRFRGSETSKGKRSFKFIAYLYSWGHVKFMWYLVLTLYMSSQSWYSCDFFCLLWLVDASVLSNFVYAGSFHPKPTQDHKVSICITIMCMRNSCWCTYCLQEKLMSMKVFSLTSFALMHMAKIHVTHCLLHHVYALTCFYVPYSHDYIHVGGVSVCYMTFQSFTCYSLLKW